MIQSSHSQVYAEAQLLIVDDQPDIRLILGRALNLVGYEVQAAASGEEALTLLERRSYDLMLLDIRMPDIEGVEIMQRARKIQPELLIIILTGYASLESAVAAVKFEAIDYLFKPVRIYEIIDSVTVALQKRAAHIQKKHLIDALEMLRQSEGNSEVLSSSNTKRTRSLLVHPLKLDRPNRLVTFVEKPTHTVPLSRGETAVLGSLMCHPDKTLSCQRLVFLAWGYDIDKNSAESLIRPYISRLRHKLEADPKDPHLICTVRRRGYVFSSAEGKQASNHSNYSS